MPKVEKNEETGAEETFYTQAELDAIKAENDKALADKDEHVKNKLKEFETGKTAQELKDIERDKQIQEAKEKAEKAETTANNTVEESRKKVKDFFVSQLVGEDADLKKKLDDSLKIVEAGRSASGLDIKSDDAIKEMTIQAANMAGIGASALPNFPMGGGYAPSFQKSTAEVSDAEHEEFLKATGYQKPPEPKVEK